MRPIALLASLSFVAALQACGGGSDDVPAVANTFRTYTVNVNTQSVKAGSYINATAEFQTFGPSISSVTWHYSHTNNAKGELAFSDVDCALGRKNTREVNGSDKVVTIWQCDTSVLAESGSKGEIMLIATAVDSDGNTADDQILISITP